MSLIRRHTLEYQPDSSLLFSRILHLPWAQFLDSCNTGAERGRYDILVADPYLTLTGTQGQFTLTRQDGSSKSLQGDAFTLIQQLLEEPLEPIDGLPFAGGALGYLAYDLGAEQYRLAEQAEISAMPSLALGFYDWAVVVDHQKACSTLVSSGRGELSQERWQELVALLSAPAITQQMPAGLQLQSELVVDADRSGYETAFQRIQHYLLEGDCYQVNYARCFRASCAGNAWPDYLRLRRQNPVPFGAFLNLPFSQVVSASPERFLAARNGRVETRPIKGTRPRSADPKQDQQYRDELQHSQKDRAENLMIVDLLRNDLGKSCKPGSIQVPELFQVEAYPTVFHLVSSVTGELQSDKTVLDLLRGCFPGGSITGAPKKRAMEIIAELERYKRGIYCGAIGYIGFDGQMDMNIAIRTMTVSAGRLCFWAGGGIVADSRVDAEFQETIDKAAAFLRLLGLADGPG
ncbi:MAG: aminodeoxychorismate synthase component I [Chromatiales bacterium]|jgi:para-aminobenzoate synthetase component 1